VPGIHGPEGVLAHQEQGLLLDGFLRGTDDRHWAFRPEISIEDRQKIRLASPASTRHPDECAGDLDSGPRSGDQGDVCILEQCHRIGVARFIDQVRSGQDR
jgi:hypothetical protein